MDQTIKFGRSIFGEILWVLQMISKNSIVTKSPLKLSWGLIAWDEREVSITIKEDAKAPLLPKVRKKRSSGSGENLPGLQN